MNASTITVKMVVQMCHHHLNGNYQVSRLPPRATYRLRLLGTACVTGNSIQVSGLTILDMC
jgi:hypothetical protein